MCKEHLENFNAGSREGNVILCQYTAFAKVVKLELCIPVNVPCVALYVNQRFLPTLSCYVTTDQIQDLLDFYSYDTIRF